MPSLSPTSLAVSDALTHYRQLRHLTQDELACVLATSGHPLAAETIARMENRERLITVDDLVALAYALDTTPAILLTHIPIDMPTPEGPFATGLPADVDHTEVRAWAEGRISLDRESRMRWFEEKVSRLRMRSTHVEEQLRGAWDELRGLGDLAEQESDARQVREIHDRIRDGEYAVNQTDIALGLAERQLERLRECAR
ncbi:helix-turn-helix domain-containing protein [Amycolatopsis sp. CA-230715]|uniref:helix-turn-helix domain-containing protein n=1 Tax=Amycolatopsis sp. CA-230715 TaxID=2745196 RepID=UPI001C01C944|nr:helix-turn-helix transcriptional regulator [Amycolatopsis sp. CA-230715]QWF85925.1 hypothetical protein HUW46_09405 [Amycolatopsis sp. CA-230715]